MQYRRLGKTNLQVSDIGFGAWQLGNNDQWGGMTDATAHELVAKALDSGINLFDTAPNYAKTNSERLLGECLKGKRQDLVLVSKFGHRHDGANDFSAAWFWQSLEASLGRLKTDYLDVILVHSPPLDVLNGTHEIWSAMKQAQEQGKVRFYGASTDYAYQVQETLDTTDAQVLELLFNVLHQDVRLAFEAVRRDDVGVITKVPLDSGWLSGKFNAHSQFEGVRERWSPEDIRHRAELIEQLAWLTEDGTPLAEKALAYLLSYDEVSCVIPGVRSLDQLRTNLAASGRTLTDKERLKLEQFWDGFTHQGRDLLPW
ncbi:MAG: aldo/keto reductase [Saccharospirillum sp.]